MTRGLSATDTSGEVENFSLSDIGNVLKKIGNAMRLPGQPEIPYAAEGTGQSGDHWGALAGALQAAGGHAQALLDDWDNQPEKVKALVPREILEALARQFGMDLHKAGRH